METKKRNFSRPPKNLAFWDLFDYFWDHGIGNIMHADGSPSPWTATTLESVLDGSPDKRSIEYWQSRTNMPSPENIRKLSIIAAGGDHAIRKAWYDAFMTARRAEKHKAKSHNVPNPEIAPSSQPFEIAENRRFRWLAVLIVTTLSLGGLGWFYWLHGGNILIDQKVNNIRICDAPYFDNENKKCSKHVSVFVHGIDEVFLSFDFENVPEGAPFERWWIRNGERVAGRTSFNDVAWPGYTYWRPGVLEVGQYVVRVVVDEKVFTQTFFVQADGFDAITIED